MQYITPFCTYQMKVTEYQLLDSKAAVTPFTAKELCDEDPG